MAKNEDGEFELILANRQLLSVFFIVVVLLGVFFTMGYIVGRNSGPAQADIASARKPESKPMVVDSSQDTAAPVSAPPTATPAPTSTQPQQPVEEPKPEPKVEAPPPKPEPAAKKESKKDRDKAKEKPAVAASAPPASGQTYLQLGATAKAEADVMVDVLHQKKFKAVAVEIPDKPGIY